MDYNTLLKIMEFLKQIGLIALGAAIPAISTYITFRRREKVIVKIHMQSYTVENLMESIRSCKECIYLNTCNFSYIVDKYNIVMENNLCCQLNFNAKNVEKQSLRSSEIIKIKDIDEYINEIKNIENLWDEYKRLFQKIIIILETKEVILNKLIEYRLLLINENYIFENNFKGIKEFFYTEIYKRIVNLERIDGKVILKLKKLENEFFKEKKNILNYLSDLNVSTQNIYFKGLFGHKVKYRIQGADDKPIFKIGDKYKTIINNNQLKKTSAMKD